MGFSWAIFSVKMSRTCARSQEVLIPLFNFCRDPSRPSLLGWERGMGSLGFRWSQLTIFGFTNSTSRADGLVPPSHQRAGDEARQWSRVILGAQQSWSAFGP